jgi:uncharacterized protein YuzE
MKLHYHYDTDSIYFELTPKQTTANSKISEGVVLDYDANGNIVGINVDNVRNTMDLNEVVLSKIPAEVFYLRA